MVSFTQSSECTSYTPAKVQGALIVFVRGVRVACKAGRVMVVGVEKGLLRVVCEGCCVLFLSSTFCLCLPLKITKHPLKPFKNTPTIQQQKPQKKHTHTPNQTQPKTRYPKQTNTLPTPHLSPSSLFLPYPYPMQEERARTPLCSQNRGASTPSCKIGVGVGRVVCERVVGVVGKGYESCL